MLGDVIRSTRSRGAAERRSDAWRVELGQQLTALNESPLVQSCAIARLGFREGDSLHGVYSSGDVLPDLLWYLYAAYRGPKIRLGIGYGDIEHAYSFPHDASGPAYKRAREAQTRNGRSRALPAVAGIDAHTDTVLTALCAMLADRYQRLSVHQRETLDRLRRGSNQVQVAAETERDAGAVSRQVKATGWIALQLGIQALTITAAPYDHRAVWRPWVNTPG